MESHPWPISSFLLIDFLWHLRSAHRKGSWESPPVSLYQLPSISPVKPCQQWVTSCFYPVCKFAEFPHDFSTGLTWIKMMFWWMARITVCPVCVPDMYAPPVCPTCVPRPCARHVCPACVPDMCAPPVCPACVPCLCARHVCPTCVSDMCALAQHVCPACVPSMCARHVCPTRVPSMCAQHVCPTCVPCLCARHVLYIYCLGTIVLVKWFQFPYWGLEAFRCDPPDLIFEFPGMNCFRLRSAVTPTCTIRG